MSALKRLAVIHARPPRPVRNRITIGQFRELMKALRELPPADDWRDEIPAYPLPAGPLIPTDASYFPF